MEEKERFELNDNDCIIDNEKDIAICDVCDVSESPKILVDLLNQQDKHIKKLQEENKKANINNYLADYWLAEKEKQQLKEQLVEKDKEIEQLKKFDDLNKTFFNLFRAAFKGPNKIDDLFNTLKTIQEKQDQDKISFAVEQLEKVKNYMITDEKDMFGANYLMNSGYVLEFIDNQIKELKGDK